MNTKKEKNSKNENNLVWKYGTNDDEGIDPTTLEAQELLKEFGLK